MQTNIFVTDIVGYSKLTGDDQKLALELLNEHDDIIEPIIKRYNGIIVKRIGDAIIATYDCSKEMIQSSVEIQQHLKNRNNRNTKNRHLLLRIGLHFGDVIMQNSELYGEGYSIASNIEPICKYGGISISDSLYKQVNENNELIVLGIKNHFFIRPIAHFTFKNSNKSILIYNLYLNLLDWYEDPFNKAYLYLSKQGVSATLYEPYKRNKKFNFEQSFAIANQFNNKNNISYAVYHYKMCIDYGEDKNINRLNLFILKIFSECGLARLVNRVIKELNFKDDNLLYLVKGINLFNEDKWDEAYELFSIVVDANIRMSDSKCSNVDMSNIDAIYYIILIKYDKDKIYTLNLIQSLLATINNQQHINILTLIQNILEGRLNDIESSYIQFEKDKLFDSTDHKFLLFVYFIVIQLYTKNNKLDKALFFQNKAMKSIEFLSNKIFGFQLKKLFNKNPLLHKKLSEPLEMDFIEEVEGLDDLDIDIDDLIKAKQDNEQSCAGCGLENKLEFKFCVSCGASLV